MMLVVLLIAGWTAAVSVLALPVIYLVLLHILYKDRKVECIDLANYGMFKFTTFWKQFLDGTHNFCDVVGNLSP